MLNNGVTCKAFPVLLFGACTALVSSQAALIVFNAEMNVFVIFTLGNLAIIFTIALNINTHLQKDCYDLSNQIIVCFKANCKNSEHYLLLKTIRPVLMLCGGLFKMSASSWLVIMDILTSNIASLVILIKQ